MNKYNLKIKTVFAKFSKSRVLIILLLILLAFAILTQGKTVHLSNIMNILVQATVTGLMTIGMALVIIDRGIDLSVGGVAALTSAIGAICMVELKIPWIICVLIMLLVGILVGFVNGITIAKLSVPPFVCTLAVLKITQGLALFLLGGRTIAGLPQAHAFFGQSSIIKIPVSVWILLIFTVLGWLILRSSRFGRELYAMGGNPKAAWIAGINVTRNRVLVYVISGFLSATAALIITSRIMCAQSTIGEGMELDAIAGAVIGGVSLAGGEGGVLGAVVGSLIIVMINNGLNLMAVSPFIQTGVKGLVIFTAVTFDALQRQRENRQLSR
jgi:ribose transport system permease protein